MFLSLALMQALSAQKLVIGDRAPELKVKSWTGAAPSLADNPVMVEFFHSSNKSSGERVKELNSIANTFSGRLVVVVVIKEQDNDARVLLDTVNRAYYIAVDDDGNTFASYGARYVPYAVISDKKGRVTWLGNPVSLKKEDLEELTGK